MKPTSMKLTVLEKLPRLRLVNRRDRWGLTLQGWLFSLALVLALGWGVFSHAHSFFAMNQPIANADLLVVEGWLTDENAQDAIQEFKAHPYRAIVTTGTRLPRGYYLSEYKSFAELSRASLIKMGVPEDKVVAVPAPGVARDRSYTSAVAFSQWLQKRDPVFPIRSANLLSESVHSRRSWMLFKRALAGQIELGVIAAPPSDYKAERWWTQSEGFKRVLFESIGWIYVQVFDKVE